MKKREEIDPVERVKLACDEINAALAAVRKIDGYQSLRTYTTAYDPINKKRGQVVLGTWHDGNFDVAYRTQGL